MHALRHDDGQVGGTGGRNYDPADVGSLVRVGGPKFGLIVSKAVGSAVIRHRVARRLRHMCARVLPDVPADTDIVIRALPGAAEADSTELLLQIRGALRKLGMVAHPSDIARNAASVAPGSGGRR